jgi:hypothetical protein
VFEELSVPVGKMAEENLEDGLMKGRAIILTVMALIAALPIGVLVANPDIGGDPADTDMDYFTAGDWAMTVYSYVFDNDSESLPGAFELDPGEMLFMYLLDCDPAKFVSVQQFSIGNPQLNVINTTGYEDGIEPAGYDVGYFEEPYAYGYSGSAEATIFNYFGDLYDPWCTLDPGEYSLVYYIAVSDHYARISASANGQGLADTRSVLGPSCIVGFRQFAMFAEHWPDTDCNDLNGWCYGADLNYNGDVNYVDLDMFTDEWLNPCPNTWPGF